MQLFDKDTNVLYDKKEAVVTMPLSEKKLLTTENFTTIDEVHKRTGGILWLHRSEERRVAIG